MAIKTKNSSNSLLKFLLPLTKQTTLLFLELVLRRGQAQGTIILFAWFAVSSVKMECHSKHLQKLSKSSDTRLSKDWALVQERELLLF